uniref:Uncharacterized protein n=1 Tax=Hyaloperonospora arabidopsidis (strain Emoy2) TaxID=559515 RepID=M4BBS4_HYAAE
MKDRVYTKNNFLKKATKTKLPSNKFCFRPLDAVHKLLQIHSRRDSSSKDRRVFGRSMFTLDRMFTDDRR